MRESTTNTVAIEICACEHTEDHLTDLTELAKKAPSAQSLASLADFFKVFGDGTRIRILYLLQEQELCVCDMAAALSMSSPAVSHQLRILKINRLIKSRRQGKSMFYSLDDHHIHDILAQGMTHVEEKYPK